MRGGDVCFFIEGDHDVESGEALARGWCHKHGNKARIERGERGRNVFKRCARTETWCSWVRSAQKHRRSHGASLRRSGKDCVELRSRFNAPDAARFKAVSLFDEAVDDLNHAGSELPVVDNEWLPRGDYAWCWEEVLEQDCNSGELPEIRCQHDAPPQHHFGDEFMCGYAKPWSRCQCFSREETSSVDVSTSASEGSAVGSEEDEVSEHTLQLTPRCPFCDDVRYDVSPWALAVARANRVASEFCAQSNNIESSRKRRVTKEKDPAPICRSFGEMRDMFLDRYGGHIRDALSGVLGKETKLEPTELAPDVQKRFMAAAFGPRPQSGLPRQLIPSFHGTHARNIDSIFARGLLVPSSSNEIRVAHGSAYGLGIYTTIGNSVSMSRSYCNAPRMVVCGLLDDMNPQIMSHQAWGRVVFDEQRIAPLFTAVGAGSLEARTVQNLGVAQGGKGQQASPQRVSNGVLRVRTSLAWSKLPTARKPLVSRVSRTIKDRLLQFLLRRAARKRSLRKCDGVRLPWFAS